MVTSIVSAEVMYEMKMLEIKRFQGREVVGQTTDGLFFEGRVSIKDDKARIDDNESRNECLVRPTEIRWLARAEKCW